uniref:Uncharacterized protein n=1 Tax=Arundo donax TaxID=35708 RepID=A0A0A9CNW6_ARUDO
MPTTAIVIWQGALLSISAIKRPPWFVKEQPLSDRFTFKNVKIEEFRCIPWGLCSSSPLTDRNTHMFSLDFCTKRSKQGAIFQINPSWTDHRHSTWRALFLHSQISMINAAIILPPLRSYSRPGAIPESAFWPQKCSRCWSHCCEQV